jgi:hypothetical protein
MHGHAELGEQERQRQQLDDQAAITSNQAGPPRGGSIRRNGAIDNLQPCNLRPDAPACCLAVLPPGIRTHERAESACILTAASAS